MLLYQYIILGVAFLIALVVYYVMNKGNEAVSNQRLIFTLLGIAIAISITGLVGFIDSIDDNIWWFILLQIFFLILGSVAVYLFSKNFFGEFKYKMASEISIIVINVMLGVIGFTCFLIFAAKPN